MDNPYQQQIADLERQIEDNRALLADTDLAELAQTEIANLTH